MSRVRSFMHKHAEMISKAAVVTTVVAVVITSH